MQAAAISKEARKGKEMGSSFGVPRKECIPAGVGFSPVRSTSEFLPPELWNNKSVLF